MAPSRPAVQATCEPNVAVADVRASRIVGIERELPRRRHLQPDRARALARPGNRVGRNLAVDGRPGCAAVGRPVELAFVGEHRLVWVTAAHREPAGGPPPGTPNSVCDDPADRDVASDSDTRLAVNYRPPRRTGIVAAVDRDVPRPPNRHIEDLGRAARGLYTLVL